MQVLTQLAAHLRVALAGTHDAGPTAAWHVSRAATTTGGAAGLCAVAGPVSAQLAVTLIGLLPWLLGVLDRDQDGAPVKGAEPAAVAAIVELAGCCRAGGHVALAQGLEGLQEGFRERRGGGWVDSSRSEMLSGIAGPLAAAFFPRCASWPPHLQVYHAMISTHYIDPQVQTFYNM